LQKYLLILGARGPKGGLMMPDRRTFNLLKTPSNYSIYIIYLTFLLFFCYKVTKKTKNFLGGIMYESLCDFCHEKFTSKSPNCRTCEKEVCVEKRKIFVRARNVINATKKNKVYNGVFKEKEYKRVCLRCGKNFIAKSKFKRLCNFCSKKAESMFVESDFAVRVYI